VTVQAGGTTVGHQPVEATAGGRWEWRVFGERFGAADDRFEALTVERIQESDELYLLSAARDATVKIRDGLMDVKRLRRVNADGLEQWTPVLKAGFPIAATSVRELVAALRIRLAGLARFEYTLEELVDELNASSYPLRVVPVQKKRVRYSVNGCMSEVTEVRAGGRTTRTIAIESEDPVRLVATVRDFGLYSHPNVNYPAGLKALLGFEAPSCAVIDVGTNSVKFHVGERGAEGGWRTIVDRAEVTRLGEGLAESGELQDKAIQRTVAAISEMADEATRHRVGGIAAVGTAGMRMARNSDTLVAAVRDAGGIAIEVISGEEESRLAYLAVRSGLGDVAASLVVFDTGGGSSQFTFGHGEQVDERFSVDVGAVRYTEAYHLAEAVPQDRLQETFDALAADLAVLDGRPAPDMLVGLGGAVTNLTAVKHGLETYDPDIVQGAVLELAEVDRQIELYAGRTADERRTIVGLQPKRAEVILAGACIVQTVMTKLGKESLTVSDRGLRHGVLAERFGPQSGDVAQCGSRGTK
jgi:exopolyphosphatase/guanosine-5'-triphosphate,3'-diphosphate pyrophosphatase